MDKYIRKNSIPILFSLWKMVIPIRDEADFERIIIHRTLDEAIDWLDVLAVDIEEIKESEEACDNNSEERV